MSNEAHFLTALRCERVKFGSHVSRLTSELVFSSSVLNMLIVVPIGFVTDFASVPRIPFAYILFSSVGDEAAVIHDFLYDKGLVSRELADEVYAEALAASDVPAWRRGPMWAAVRAFGARRYKLPTSPQISVDVAPVSTGELLVRSPA